MRRALPLLVLLALGGCKGSREKDLVGKWSGPSIESTLAADKTFKASMGPMALEGTWALEGNDVTLTPKTMNGKPVAELKAQLEKSLAAVPASQRGQAAEMVQDLDTPNVMTLSDDGKTLTTNKAKDKNKGAGMTLTKA